MGFSTKSLNDQIFLVPGNFLYKGYKKGAELFFLFYYIYFYQFIYKGCGSKSVYFEKYNKLKVYRFASAPFILVSIIACLVYRQ